MSLLEQILQNKRREVAELWRRTIPARFNPRPVHLRREAGSTLQLITEIKLRSPSAGPLSRVLSVTARAACYERGGASMLSVICDSRYFDGSYEHLTLARQACDLPLLCKDFVIDERQLDAAAAYGADAVLLIVRCLSGDVLPTLIEAAQQRGLTPLVEVHTHTEAQRALASGAQVVGVNARDLDTLVLDVPGAGVVLSELPPHVTAIHLSGIKTPDDLVHQRGTRADAVLVGETLMAQDDPSELLASFAQAAAG